MTTLQKVNVLIVLLYAQYRQFWKKEKSTLTILFFLLSSLLFTSQKNHKNMFYNSISLPWPLTFLPKHLFCLSHCKTCWTMVVDNVDLKICLLATSNSMVILILFFIGVNLSGPETSSTSNHRFYRTLGQLHGPWCKQPLTGKIELYIYIYSKIGLLRS